MSNPSKATSYVQYPLDAKCYVPPGQDPALYQEMLVENSSDLFQVTGGGMNMYLGGRGDSVQCQFVSSEDLENTSWGGGSEVVSEGQGKVFWVQPAFSWGQLEITETAFRRLLAEHRVFTPFLDIVHGFGAKISDYQRAHDFVHLQLHTMEDFEIGYNIRYYELNGRGRGNPWSLRQAGVYQQMLTTQCVWIVISVSKYLRPRFGRFLDAHGSTEGGCCATFVLLGHLVILSMTTRNWGAYIEHMRHKLILLEQKMRPSFADGKSSNASSLLLQDVSKASDLCNTIETSRAVLESQVNVLLTLKRLHAGISNKKTDCCSCDVASAFQLKHMEIRNHLKAVNSMQKSAERIPQIISTILSARGEERLHATLAQIQTGVHGTLSTSLQVHDDVKALVQVATSGHQDSKTIKLLAEIATVFLPLSFLAAIFDSEILNSSYLGGIYAALSILLVLLTVIVILLLERKATKT
ncbi:uncharacterized protein FMAN_14624 [Fusarium mangiferae]|uniref:CorA-like transporter domain-containing protein n=1 Tax=Fusarium mangiferae TaxID=192010 RepID=A0A1L7UDP9_FUSMA|nr:uncharacterized protein FMAN_14624 [Fusarium mangiferae]CVL08804.1 uncharacterized protein FMAN_14624 [Fusarium mangiferae]